LGLAIVSKEIALVIEKGHAIDGAILDINLGGLKVFPIADLLSERGVPFIFLTGYGSARSDLRYAEHTTISKPFRRKSLENVLISTFKPPTC
jgi:DNA-binding response OmpR family regulator